MRTLLTMWAVEGMWAIDRPADWVGRDHELAVLRAGVEAVRRGEGAAVWVEGEPGIGKSTLVAEALAETSGLGWDVGWGIADRLTERLPLRVMLDCLQVRADSADPRRAQAAGLIRSRHPGPFTDGDASSVGVEVLVTLAAELCGAVPMVMVIDDVQWADETSLVVWHQLAASIGQLPLLLIATCRLSPRPAQLRRAAARLGPASTVSELVVLLRRPASELAAGVQEAVTAGSLVASGPELAFRHRLIQQALYENMPAALRTALHAEAAQELAAAGADTLTVAQQLSSAGRPGDDWAKAWLIQAAPTLTTRAPQLAADLLRRGLKAAPAGPPAPEGGVTSLR